MSLVSGKISNVNAKHVGLGCGGCLGAVVVLLILFAFVSQANVSLINNGRTMGPTVGGVGATLNVTDNLNVTLTGYILSKGDSVDTPKSGDQYAITHWQFRNSGSLNTAVADTSFTAKSNGVTTKPIESTGLSKNLVPLAGRTLSAGRSYSGDIVFEVKKGVPATVIYKSSGIRFTWHFHG